jgi:uncharacterized YigZ family protein
LKDYKSVYHEGYYLYEEKRSRFIARVRPVITEQEAIDFINGIKAECWDATHNCYAYHVANEAVYQRYSDDGEPSGTAGMPILEVIRKKQLMNVVVVVTRYFGGILLGAGGLVRAYGKAAAGGLEDACEIWVKTCIHAKIRIEYHLSGKLQNMLMQEGFLVRDVAYTDDVTFEVLLEEQQRDDFEKMLNDLTGGRSNVTYLGKVPVKLDLKGNVLEMG